MRKILGKKDKDYFIQTNNASLLFSLLYTKVNTVVSCGETSISMALSITGNKLPNIEGVQPEDIFSMYFLNSLNFEKFSEIRKLDYMQYPPNTVPQLFPLVIKEVTGSDCASFSFGLTVDDVISEIKKDNVVIVCLEMPFGGHFVVVRGFDIKERKLIYADPYPRYGGFDQEISFDEFIKKRHTYKIIVKSSK